MYFKLKRTVDAQLVFDSLLSTPTSVSWTLLLQGYLDDGKNERVLEMFRSMNCVPDSWALVVALSACSNLAVQQQRHRQTHWLEQGKFIHSRAVDANACGAYVQTALIDMYAKCGSMVDAQCVFHSMLEREVTSWTSLITGYVSNGDSRRALELIPLMDLDGITLNALTFIAALAACGSLMTLDLGRRFHDEARACGLINDVLVANSLVDFYSKCANVELARQVFDSIAHKTTVSWTALMYGYSLQGDTNRVIELFPKMREQGVAPDEVTFLCLLSACSHAGLTEQGKGYFEAMRSEYGIAPNVKHYACVIDLLCRANQLDEALKLADEMPYQPAAPAWTAILDACRNKSGAMQAKLAFKSLLDLDPNDSGAYILMANFVPQSSSKISPDLL